MKNKEMMGNLDKKIKIKRREDTEWGVLSVISIIGMFVVLIVLLLSSFLASELITIFSIILLFFVVSVIFTLCMSYKKEVELKVLEVARWIGKYWIHDNHLDKDFFKYNRSKFDDEIDKALSIIEKEYGVKT